MTSNCGRIGAIGSSPSNSLKPNMWGQKGFNPLCQCVYVYVCIVNPDIQTIHRCSHTSIHTYIHKYIYTYIYTYIHIHTHTHRDIVSVCVYVKMLSGGGWPVDTGAIYTWITRGLTDLGHSSCLRSQGYTYRCRFLSQRVGCWHRYHLHMDY